MNLTLNSQNISPTLLRINLVSWAANRFSGLKVRYLIYDAALTEMESVQTGFYSTLTNGNNFKSNQDLVFTYTTTSITLTSDVGIFATLSGFDLISTSNYDFNWNINGVTTGGNNVQFTVTSTTSNIVKVFSMTFAIFIWNRDKIETAAIPTRIYY